MGKNNKDKAPITAPDNNQEPVMSTDAVIPPDSIVNDAPEDPDKMPTPTTKKDVALDDRKEYTVIVINLSPLKAGTEKIVSGNVAKALIKKGFVKLKN